MIIKSNLKPRDYTEKEAVRIYNRDQQTFYIDSNVYPVDVYTSYSPKCERKIIIMTFIREDTKEVYKNGKIMKQTSLNAQIRALFLYTKIGYSRQ